MRDLDALPFARTSEGRGEILTVSFCLLAPVKLLDWQRQTSWCERRRQVGQKSGHVFPGLLQLAAQLRRRVQPGQRLKGAGPRLFIQRQYPLRHRQRPRRGQILAARLIALHRDPRENIIVINRLVFPHVFSVSCLHQKLVLLFGIILSFFQRVKPW